MHTKESVSKLLASRWEDQDTPDKVLTALHCYEGKNITTRILDKLPGGKDKWRLRRQYGMTHLVTLDYLRSEGNQGISLLLAHTETSFPFDAADMVKRNPAYFDAAKDRNRRRMEARNDAAALDKMAFALNQVEDALAALTQAKDNLEALTEYHSVFAPDKYEFERICGLRQSAICAMPRLPHER
jgi:hypothetical protein